jgi:hypothetical protein
MVRLWYRKPKVAPIVELSACRTLASSVWRSRLYVTYFEGTDDLEPDLEATDSLRSCVGSSFGGPSIGSGVTAGDEESVELLEK